MILWFKTLRGILIRNYILHTRVEVLLVTYLSIFGTAKLLFSSVVSGKTKAVSLRNITYASWPSDLLSEMSLDEY